MQLKCNLIPAVETHMCFLLVVHAILCMYMCTIDSTLLGVAPFYSSAVFDKF